MSKRLGIVVETHPDDHSVDLVMVDDGARLTGVQVQASSGSSSYTGSVDMPDVTPNGDKWDITQRNKDQDMIATVSYIGRIPIVDGFLYPQINQMLFKDKKTKFYRHQSGVYQVIDGDGNAEFFHPSGFYIRMGEEPDHVDLAGKNVDKSLAHDRNTGKRMNFRVATGGNTVVLTMTPDGEVSFKLEQDFIVEAQGNIAMEAAGNISLKAGGTITTESGGNTTLKAPTVRADGNFDVTGDTTVKAITSNGKDVGDTHKHLGVTPGSGKTGTPE